MSEENPTNESKILDKDAFMKSFLDPSAKLDDLKQFIKKDEPAAKTEEEPVQPEAKVEPEAEIEEDPEKEGQPAKEEEKSLPKQVRAKITSEEDLEIIKLAKENDLSIADAAALYDRRKNPSAPAQEKKPAEPAPKREPAKPAEDPRVVEFNKSLESIDTEIADLEKKLEEANDDMDVAKMNQLNRKLGQLDTKRAGIELRRDNYVEQKEARIADEWNRLEAAAEKEVFAKYPQLKDRKTLEARAFQGFINEQDPKDPRFQSPDWMIGLADEFAEEQGLTAESGKPGKPTEAQTARTVTTTPAKKQVPRHNPAKLVNAGDGLTSPEAKAGAPDKEAIFEEFMSLPPEERAKALSQVTKGTSVLNRGIK